MIMGMTLLGSNNGKVAQILDSCKLENLIVAYVSSYRALPHLFLQLFLRYSMGVSILYLQISIKHKKYTFSSQLSLLTIPLDNSDLGDREAPHLT